VLAGADFFTVEVLTWHGLVTYHVLFFLEVSSRRVWLGGITRHPDSAWMQQVARNATMQETGYLKGCGYLLHDRDQPRVSGHSCDRGCGVRNTTGAQPEFERPRGALGTFHQSRMSVETDPIRGDLAATRRVEFSGTLP
jgi:hypothetical protein